MIMTAELNSHQRVSYYTGVKLIRHHQSASTANPNNSTTNTNNGNNASTNSSTSGAFYHQHHNHFPPHPPHHHPHNHQHQHPPPLPPHHPGHFHLPCPTGPPHIQHPGGVLHLNNHHGPPHHPHHPNHNGPHHYGGGGGSNQTTRLYTGSPLIRSTAYHSSSSATTGSGSGIGGLGSSKRSFKNHQHRNNHIFHSHHTNGRNGGIGNPSHYHNPNIIGGSCSSGSSSSSSSNEHLNSIQSPTSSPITQAKLDISPLKLSSSPTLNGELSSSNNSSPGPQGSPSPSTASNLSTSSSSSPNSTDGNKDLDHFYFLDEHWKPSSDGSNSASGIGGIAPADMLDINSSSNCARWTRTNSGSPSPLTVTSTSATTLTMMVDQFFANGHNHNFGSVDGNNNFIGINRDGLGGGLVLRDSNNNIIRGQQPDFNEIHTRNDRYYDSFNSSGFSSGNNVNGSGSEGASGLFNFGGGAKFNGIHNSSSTATTVVNVETQIGTFNGQRDLEIRLCFIKGDHHSKVHRGSVYGGNHQSQIDTQYPTTLMRSAGENDGKRITAIGDPFKSSKSEHAELQKSASSTDSEMENKGDSHAAIIPIHKNKEIAQQS